MIEVIAGARVWRVDNDKILLNLPSTDALISIPSPASDNWIEPDISKVPQKDELDLYQFKLSVDFSGSQ